MVTTPFNLLTEDFPVMKIALHLYRVQRRRIEGRFRKTRNHIEATGCRILLLLNSGHTASSASQVVGCARATIYRTVYRFEELREAGLSDQRFFPEARKVNSGTHEIPAFPAGIVASEPWRATVHFDFGVDGAASRRVYGGEAKRHELIT